MNILAPGVYDETLTLRDEVNKLSNPDYPISPKDLANLIVKYAMCFIVPNLVGSQIAEDTFHGLLATVGKVLSTEDLPYEDPQLIKIIRSTRYQLSMLLDISCTITLLLEIMQTRVSDIVGDGNFYGLDMGSGSGILTLALYIQGKRSGLNVTRENIVGIEKNGEALLRSRMLFMRLGGIARVVPGNTVNPEIHSRVKVAGILHSIVNENVPSINIGFSEPFFQNLINLEVYLGEANFALATIFPRGLQISSLLDPNGSEKEVYIGPDYSNGKKVYFLNDGCYTQFTPKRLLIGGKYVDLDKIGGEHLYSTENPHGVVVSNLGERWILVE